MFSSPRGAMLVGYTVSIHGECGNTRLDMELPAESTVICQSFMCILNSTVPGSQKMMTHLMEHYVTSEEGMWLGTNTANARAISFYERVGFEQIGTENLMGGARKTLC